MNVSFESYFDNCWDNDDRNITHDIEDFRLCYNVRSFSAYYKLDCPKSKLFQAMYSGSPMFTNIVFMTAVCPGKVAILINYKDDEAEMHVFNLLKFYFNLIKFDNYCIAPEKDSFDDDNQIQNMPKYKAILISRSKSIKITLYNVNNIHVIEQPGADEIMSSIKKLVNNSDELMNNSEDRQIVSIYNYTIGRH